MTGADTTTVLPLGKQSRYDNSYAPSLLRAIPRHVKRAEIGIAQGASLPFHGVDIWNAFELSWLNLKGKPVIALGELLIPYDSPNLVESKSIKLYLNSLNQHYFRDVAAIEFTLSDDLSTAASAKVTVNVITAETFTQQRMDELPGICLDSLDIHCDCYQIDPAFLQSDRNEITSETLVSHLLKSNCPVTNQPDWGTVQIDYTGPKINHEGLLRYIVSFRQHNEFHEQCIERMFMDITRRCQPQQLSIYGRYTRRGGLDINPFRSTGKSLPQNIRTCRQ